MAQKKVTVLLMDGKFIVDPPVVRLKLRKSGADRLKLSNDTNEDLIWNLENPEAFGAPILEIVKSKKASKEKTARTIGEYPYQVLMIRSGKKGKGNSDPVIIIEN
jgi:hypothetical protein